MITYVYKCDSCETSLEVRQSIHEEALKKCSKCGEDNLRRVIQTPNIRFKGSGFYSTDHSADDLQGKSLGPAPRKGIDI